MEQLSGTIVRKTIVPIDRAFQGRCDSHLQARTSVRITRVYYVYAGARFPGQGQTQGTTTDLATDRKRSGTDSGGVIKWIIKTVDTWT